MHPSTTHDEFPDIHKTDSHPNEMMSRLTGILLILSVLGFFLPFSILLVGLQFVDQPFNIAFPIFRQQSTTILLSYYALAWDGLVLILSVLLLYRIFNGREAFSLAIATVCGVLGGLMQTIGDLRWPFLLPSLTSTYFDPHSNQATRSAIEVVFQAMDQFAGVELSEHLYYLFIGAWSLLLGLYLLRSFRSERLLSWLGIISGCSLLISSIEQFDWPTLGPALLVVVALSRIVWGVWLLTLATKLLRRRSEWPNVLLPHESP